MDKVDYLRLAEQYAAFLVAVGSVSITVLALVLNLGSKREEKEPTELQKDSSTFLIAALIVATVSCFIGAHMMSETSASISYSKEILKEEREKVLQETGGKKPLSDVKEKESEEPRKKPWGTRLFFLASTNIFVAALLVLFALMLLPAASGAENAARITPVCITVFLSVTAGILWWMWLAAEYRMHMQCPRVSIGVPLIISILWFSFLLCKFEKPWTSFAPIVILTVFLLGYFAWTFADAGTSLETLDMGIFCLIVFVSCASLLASGIRIMWK